MAIKYDLTAVEILKLLGYSKTIGKESLEAFEKENNLKLPTYLFNFLSIIHDNPLLATADIWNNLYFSYEDIEERIEENKEYWEENPNDCTEDDYFKFSQIPKDKWSDYVTNYLQIGSDYSAGVVVFGIDEKDLVQENPPVYILHEADDITDWKIIYNKLSDYIMAVTLDVLSCANYHTAKNVLQKDDWNFYEYSNSKEAKKLLSDNNIDLYKMNKYLSLYGANAFCLCCYNDKKQSLFIIRDDEDDFKLFIVSKLIYNT